MCLGLFDVFSHNDQNTYLSPSVPNDVEAELQSELCIKGGMVFSAASKDEVNLKTDCDQQLKTYNSYNKQSFVNDVVNNHSIEDQSIRLPG